MVLEMKRKTARESESEIQIQTATPKALLAVPAITPLLCWQIVKLPAQERGRTEQHRTYVRFCDVKFFCDTLVCQKSVLSTAAVFKRGVRKGFESER